MCVTSRGLTTREMISLFFLRVVLLHLFPTSATTPTNLPLATACTIPPTTADSDLPASTTQAGPLPSTNRRRHTLAYFQYQAPVRFFVTLYHVSVTLDQVPTSPLGTDLPEQRLSHPPSLFMCPLMSKFLQ